MDQINTDHSNHVRPAIFDVILLQNWVCMLCYTLQTFFDNWYLMNSNLEIRGGIEQGI
jgi:hypothetical protein